eukprot:TRINITY_DN4797_c0_g1_i1.p1 TRINITY_DN4797_c0_g1~~TRINITY_DN4797_c0_g1_i1.p1  ORF type:complete len:230 (-),score=47.04 TRINITY_DN4797_c0_g1_i1:20-616(-)
MYGYTTPDRLSSSQGGDFGFDDFDDESIVLPLHLELGINFDHIRGKTLAVLNPFSVTYSEEILRDCDIAGPLCFSILLGVILLLGQKWTFDYIYGITVVGSVGMYVLLNLMSDYDLEFYGAFSILGYSILPILILAICSLFIPLNGFVGGIIALACILWSTFSSTTLFAQLLRLRNQKILIGYPIGLYYLCISLLTIF